MTKPKLLLDSNILIDGILSNWSASKALLIIMREVELFEVSISAISVQEIEEFLISNNQELYIEEYLNYLKAVKINILPLPDKGKVLAARNELLPVLKHVADLPILVTAINNNIDWIISNNRVHFNDILANKINIRIASAGEFLKNFEI